MKRIEITENLENVNGGAFKKNDVKVEWELVGKTYRVYATRNGITVAEAFTNNLDEAMAIYHDYLAKYNK